jgi:catechol 2,3-dioxygenase-like lactoylglutathione lyase family enzyme
MASIRGVTPFLRVPDIGQAVSFFVDTLGFKIGFEGGGYAYVWREGAAFRLVQDDMLAPRGEGRYTSYVDVEDVDALYAELKPKLDLLPPEHVCGPFDQHYGQREFTVVGPDGDLIAFGMAIPGFKPD